MKLIRVAPVGKRIARGFRCYTDGTSDNEWVEDAYPPSPDGDRFREARVAAGLGLRECARKLGLKPSEVSDLEFGRAVPADGWAALGRALAVGGELPSHLHPGECRCERCVCPRCKERWLEHDPIIGIGGVPGAASAVCPDGGLAHEDRGEGKP